MYHTENHATDYSSLEYNLLAIGLFIVPVLI